MKKIMLIGAVAMILLQSCREVYSQGERVGTITKFAQQGQFTKTWEGELHVTQTGMNSTAKDFDFSIDADRENERKNVIANLDSAAKFGWKVRLMYHECVGENITGNRGHTNFFVDSLIVEDKNFAYMYNSGGQVQGNYPTGGHVIDTIYVVIQPKK
jgi:hypothetical protein